MTNLTRVGPDGITRTYDEHYDTKMDVEQDPTGALWAIHAQYEHIEVLQEKVNKALALFEEIIERQTCEFAKVRSIIPELKK